MRRRVGIILVVSALFAALAVPVSNAAPKEGKPNPNDKALVACDNTTGHPNRPRFCTAPALEVTSSGPSQTQAGALVRALALDIPEEEVIDGDGAVRYLDPELFQVVPTFRDVAQNPLGGDDDAEGSTTVDILDIASLLDLEVISDDTALGTIAEALSTSGLLPDNYTTLTSNATIQLERNPALLPSEVPALPTELREGVDIDTQVSYQLQVGEGENAIPLTGPGAKIKVSFAPDGTVSQLLYSALDVASTGPAVQIVPEDQAPALCQAALDLPANATLTTELVYYAPPLDSGVEQILPHFTCDTSVPGEYGEDVPDGVTPSDIVSRQVLIPAVVDAPQVSIDASFDGTAVAADSSVMGGTAPYSYQWSSAVSTLDEQTAQQEDISYVVSCRAAEQASGAEELLLTVTDANGLQATGRADLNVSCGGSPEEAGSLGLDAAGLAASRADDSSADSHSGGIQVGVDWIGTYNHQGDLPGVPGNATGFRNGFSSGGTPTLYNWGNNNAFERDFKDLDTTVADASDLTFYTGHANGDGWVMESNVADQWVGFWDTRLGDHDAEWLVLGACGALHETTGGGSWATRWGPMFRGLHMMLGYATNSQDTSQEGQQFANYANAGWYLYQAWGQQAINIQPSWVQYGYGGPVGVNYEWNAYDHFWNKGSVTGDISPANTWYYWRTVGNA